MGCLIDEVRSPDIHFRKMEAEIVQMGIRMFNGGPDACGTVSSSAVARNVMLFMEILDDFRRIGVFAAGLQSLS